MTAEDMFLELGYNWGHFKHSIYYKKVSHLTGQCISNYGTLLEMYGKGHFKGIDTSTPIHEILDNCKVV